ncbi:hypothetical protein [Flavobacterium sp.]|uniref:hypothetical protein n=1 Tax=Flavobacterium sp. TaxID=239 RepID=UPI004033828F
MSKIRKLIRYVYWCGANLNYRTFGESGDIGKMLLCLIYAMFLLITVCLLQVVMIGHQDANEVYGTDIVVVAKFVIVGLAGLIYYGVHRKFRNYPILKNPEFMHVSDKTRRVHTALIFLFLAFEFYALLVIMSPSFHPSQLSFYSSFYVQSHELTEPFRHILYFIFLNKWM